MRKLATVRKIKEIIPIVGADLIELVIVDGWQCVVKKGDFKVGDKGIYFEIDSFLPIIPIFEFLRKGCFKRMGEKEGFRLRTIKLRKQRSQGIIMPLSQFADIIDGIETMSVNEDLTEILNVDKFEKPIAPQLAGSVVGSFPSFIRKTDQERIQNEFDPFTAEFNDNNEEIIEELTAIDPIKFKERIQELTENRTPNLIKDLLFEETIKLDGSSMTCFIIDPIKFQTKKIGNMLQDTLPEDYFGVCSRNLELKENPDNTLWKVALRDFKEAMKDYHKTTKRNIAIQGEIMGPGIQGNREQLKDHEMFVYEIWDIDNQRYLTRDERHEITSKYNLKEVPFIRISKVFDIFKTVNDILDYAEGPSLNHPTREGIVFKSTTLVNGYTVSFKAISNKFLLKGGD